MYIPCLIIFYLFLFLVLMVPFEANFYFICLSSKCMISNHTMKAKDKLCTWGKLKVSFFVQYHRSLMGKNILHILIWTLKNLKTTIHETSLDIWFLWIYKLRRTKGKTKLEKLTSICKVHFLFSHRRIGNSYNMHVYPVQKLMFQGNVSLSDTMPNLDTWSSWWRAIHSERLHYS
jgi:hypothetical protein